MHKLFLDANILFAATYSEAGASRALFRLAKKRKIKLVSNTYAIKEALKNIKFKIGEEKVPTFYQLISLLSAVDKETDYETYESIITQKDAPILAGTKNQKTDYLITLDRKDFLTDKINKTKLPFSIMTPGEYLQSL